MRLFARFKWDELKDKQKQYLKEAYKEELYKEYVQSLQGDRQYQLDELKNIPRSFTFEYDEFGKYIDKVHAKSIQKDGYFISTYYSNEKGWVFYSYVLKNPTSMVEGFTPVDSFNIYKDLSKTLEFFKDASEGICKDIITIRDELYKLQYDLMQINKDYEDSLASDEVFDNFCDIWLEDKDIECEVEL